MGARVGLLVALAFILAPVLVVTEPHTAHALVPPPIGAPILADALEVGAGRALVGGLGVICSTGVGCVAAGVAGLIGLGLYETRDTWLPFVKDWLNDPEQSATGAPGASGGTSGLNANCLAYGNISFTEMPGAGTNPWEAGRVTVTYPVPQCIRIDNGQDEGLGATRFRFTERLTCRNTTTNALVSSTWVGVAGVADCAGGYVPVQVSFTQCLAPNPGCGDTNVSFSDMAWSSGQTLDESVMTTIVHCVSADGSQTGDATLEGPASRGFPMPSCAAAFGEGWHGVGIETRECDTRDTAQCLTVFKAQRDDTAYPQCNEPNPLCYLEVFVDGQACTVGNADCVDWAQLVQTAPSRVTCHFGPYTVPMSNCNVLEYNYSPTPVRVTNPDQVDGDPATGSPRPQPETQPSPSPSTEPSPGSTPGTTPSTGGFPTTGSNPATGDGPASDNCISGAWSWNPVNWVYVPVKCVLIWAFEPSAATQTALTEAGSATNGKAPFAQITSISAQLGGLADPGSTCWVAGVDMPSPIGHVDALDSCTPDPVTGILQTFRSLLAVAIYISVLAPLAWWAWKQYAPGAAGSA